MKRRILAVLIAAVFAVLIAAGPARAAQAVDVPDPACVVNPLACAGGKIGGGVADAVVGDGCEGPPPAAPDLGPTSWLTRTPDPIPPAADPFAKGATTTIYEQYGLGWARWRTCDLATGPDLIMDPGAQADTGIGSWILTVPTFLTSLYAAVIGVAMHPSTWLGWLQPALNGLVDGLREGVTTPMLAILLLIATIWLLAKAYQGRVSVTITALAMVVMVGAGVAVLTDDPFRWVESGSEETAQIVGGVSASTSAATGNGTSTDPATQAISQVVDTVIYDSWLQGIFGSSDSATAQKYGPKLLAAGSLNWSETEQIRAGKGGDIIKEKQEAWKKAMADLKAEDPEAYEYATGRGENRVWSALRSLFAMLCVLPILLVGALVILAFPIHLIVCILHLLLVLPIALLPSQVAMKHVKVPIMTALGAFMNAVAMGVAMAVQLAVVAVLFDPANHVPIWLALVLCAAVTLIAWKVTRGHRGVIDTASSKAWQATKFAGGYAIAGATGGWAAGVAEQALAREHDEEQRKAEQERQATDGEATDDSAHAERAAAPEPTPDAAEEAAQREERFQMNHAVLQAKNALNQVPEPRKGGYQSPFGAPVSAPESGYEVPASTKRRAGESIPEEDPRPSGTGYPSAPATTSPEPTGWPQPEPVEPATDAGVPDQGEPSAVFDDGGVPSKVWTPETGEMTLEESYAAVQSPAIEVEPADSFVPVEARRSGSGWPGSPAEVRTTTFGGSE